jgi:hypothetical protein
MKSRSRLAASESAESGTIDSPESFILYGRLMDSPLYGCILVSVISVTSVMTENQSDFAAASQNQGTDVGDAGQLRRRSA